MVIKFVDFSPPFARFIGDRVPYLSHSVVIKVKNRNDFPLCIKANIGEFLVGGRSLGYACSVVNKNSLSINSMTNENDFVLFVADDVDNNNNSFKFPPSCVVSIDKQVSILLPNSEIDIILRVRGRQSGRVSCPLEFEVYNGEIPTDNEDDILQCVTVPLDVSFLGPSLEFSEVSVVDFGLMRAHDRQTIRISIKNNSEIPALARIVPKMHVSNEVDAGHTVIPKFPYHHHAELITAFLEQVELSGQESMDSTLTVPLSSTVPRQFQANLDDNLKSQLSLLQPLPTGRTLQTDFSSTLDKDKNLIDHSISVAHQVNTQRSNYSNTNNDNNLQLNSARSPTEIEFEAEQKQLLGLPAFMQALAATQSQNMQYSDVKIKYGAHAVDKLLTEYTAANPTKFHATDEFATRGAGIVPCALPINLSSSCDNSNSPAVCASCGCLDLSGRGGVFSMYSNSADGDKAQFRRLDSDRDVVLVPGYEQIGQYCGNDLIVIRPGWFVVPPQNSCLVDITLRTKHCGSIKGCLDLEWLDQCRTTQMRQIDFIAHAALAKVSLTPSKTKLKTVFLEQKDKPVKLTLRNDSDIPTSFQILKEDVEIIPSNSLDVHFDKTHGLIERMSTTQVLVYFSGRTECSTATAQVKIKIENQLQPLFFRLYAPVRGLEVLLRVVDEEVYKRTKIALDNGQLDIPTQLLIGGGANNNIGSGDHTTGGERNSASIGSNTFSLVSSARTATEGGAPTKLNGGVSAQIFAFLNFGVGGEVNEVGDIPLNFGENLEVNSSKRKYLVLTNNSGVATSYSIKSKNVCLLDDESILFNESSVKNINNASREALKKNEGISSFSTLIKRTKTPPKVPNIIADSTRNRILNSFTTAEELFSSEPLPRATKHHHRRTTAIDLPKHKEDPLIDVNYGEQALDIEHPHSADGSLTSRSSIFSAGEASRHYSTNKTAYDKTNNNAIKGRIIESVESKHVTNTSTNETNFMFSNAEVVHLMLQRKEEQRQADALCLGEGWSVNIHPCVGSIPAFHSIALLAEIFCDRPGSVPDEAKLIVEIGGTGAPVIIPIHGVAVGDSVQLAKNIIGLQLPHLKVDEMDFEESSKSSPENLQLQILEKAALRGEYPVLKMKNVCIQQQIDPHGSALLASDNSNTTFDNQSEELRNALLSKSVQSGEVAEVGAALGMSFGSLKLQNSASQDAKVVWEMMEIPNINSFSDDNNVLPLNLVSCKLDSSVIKNENDEVDRIPAPSQNELAMTQASAAPTVVPLTSGNSLTDLDNSSDILDKLDFKINWNTNRPPCVWRGKAPARVPGGAHGPAHQPPSFFEGPHNFLLKHFNIDRPVGSVAKRGTSHFTVSFNAKGLGPGKYSVRLVANMYFHKRAKTEKLPCGVPAPPEPEIRTATTVEIIKKSLKSPLFSLGPRDRSLSKNQPKPMPGHALPHAASPTRNECLSWDARVRDIHAVHNLPSNVKASYLDSCAFQNNNGESKSASFSSDASSTRPASNKEDDSSSSSLAVSDVGSSVHNNVDADVNNCIDSSSSRSNVEQILIQSSSKNKINNISDQQCEEKAPSALDIPQKNSEYSENDDIEDEHQFEDLNPSQKPAVVVVVDVEVNVEKSRISLFANEEDAKKGFNDSFISHQTFVPTGLLLNSKSGEVFFDSHAPGASFEDQTNDATIAGIRLLGRDEHTSVFPSVEVDEVRFTAVTTTPNDAKFVLAKDVSFSGVLSPNSILSPQGLWIGRQLAKVNALTYQAFMRGMPPSVGDDLEDVLKLASRAIDKNIVNLSTSMLNSQVSSKDLINGLLSPLANLIQNQHPDALKHSCALLLKILENRVGSLQLEAAFNSSTSKTKKDSSSKKSSKASLAVQEIQSLMKKLHLQQLLKYEIGDGEGIRRTIPIFNHSSCTIRCRLHIEGPFKFEAITPQGKQTIRSSPTARLQISPPLIIPANGFVRVVIVFCPPSGGFMESLALHRRQQNSVKTQFEQTLLHTSRRLQETRKAELSTSADPSQALLNMVIEESPSLQATILHLAPSLSKQERTLLDDEFSKSIELFGVLRVLSASSPIKSIREALLDKSDNVLQSFSLKGTCLIPRLELKVPELPLNLWDSRISRSIFVKNWPLLDFGFVRIDPVSTYVQNNPAKIGKNRLSLELHNPTSLPVEFCLVHVANGLKSLLGPNEGSHLGNPKSATVSSTLEEVEVIRSLDDPAAFVFSTTQSIVLGPTRLGRALPKGGVLPQALDELLMFGTKLSLEETDEMGAECGFDDVPTQIGISFIPRKPCLHMSKFRVLYRLANHIRANNVDHQQQPNGNTNVEEWLGHLDFVLRGCGSFDEMDASMKDNYLIDNGWRVI